MVRSMGAFNAIEAGPLLNINDTVWLWTLKYGRLNGLAM